MKKIILYLIALTSLLSANEYVDITSNKTVVIREEANPVASFRVDDITHLTSDEKGNHYVHLKYNNYSIVTVKGQMNFNKIQEAYMNIQR